MFTAFYIPLTLLILLGIILLVMGIKELVVGLKLNDSRRKYSGIKGIIGGNIALGMAVFMWSGKSVMESMYL